MRLDLTNAATGVCLACVAGLVPPLLAHPAHVPDSHSWAAVQTMWRAVQADAWRRKLFFSDRYYVERFESGTCPLPYTAYQRIKIALAKEAGRALLVVNRQCFLPWDKGGHYHGVYFAEQELVFDTRWRFQRARQWMWGTGDAPGRRPRTLAYGGRRDQALAFYAQNQAVPGVWTARREGNRVVFHRKGKRPKAFPINGSLPPADAVALLIHVAADLVASQRNIVGWSLDEGTETGYGFGCYERLVPRPLGVPLIEIEHPSHDYAFQFSTGEYSYSHPQLGWEVRLSTQAVYRRALRVFRRGLDMNALTDDRGRPVDLPLGLRDLAPTAATRFPSLDAAAVALRHADWRVRKNAADTLGARSDPRALRPLAAALADDDHDVRQAGALALDRLGWTPRTDADKANYLVARQRWADCPGLGAAVVPALSRALRDWRLASHAEDALVAIGDPALPALIAALRDRSHAARWAAASALARLGEAQAVPALIAALTDDSLWVRARVSNALGNIADDRAIRPLARALEDRERGVRQAAARALATIGDRRAVPALIPALRDWHCRRTVAEALQSLGWEPRTVEQAVHLAIGKARRSISENPDWGTWEATKPILLRDLRSADPRVVRYAAYALIEIGNEEIVADLIAALERRGTKVMAEAYRNSLHPRLRAAANAWVVKHGYPKMPDAPGVHGSYPVSWRSWQTR